MKQGLLVLVILIVLIVGVMVLSRTGNKQTTTVSPTPTVTPPATKKIPLTEISKHAAADDCWFAIEGKVYDVTSYIASNRHPGEQAIVQGCGQDATVLFNTRPMGSGTPHSDKARAGLKKFYIGELVQ